jgi:hypothetical protein
LVFFVFHQHQEQQQELVPYTYSEGMEVAVLKQIPSEGENEVSKNEHDCREAALHIYHLKGSTECTAAVSVCTCDAV